MSAPTGVPGRVVHVAAGREWRGGERQVWLLARELARLGVPQVLVTARDSVLARRAREAGVDVVEAGWSIGLDPRALLTTISQTRALPATIHAHDPHALRLALLARPAGAPLVATRRVTFAVRAGGTWTRADRVIAISEAVARALVAGGVARERIAVIPSAVPVAEIARATPGGWRARLHLPADAPLLVNVAALTPEKGHEVLLESAARLRATHPAARWLVAGDGPLRGTLAASARRLGLADVVRWLGHVDDVAGLLADADVVVSASTAEGLGSTLLDAMALARPIVAAAAGGVPEVLAEGAGLLVPPGAADALARAVSRVLAEPELAAALRAAAGRRAAAFGVERMAERTVEVYRSVSMETERA
ncbi:MAG TPA: glycosyltransferase [Gemmatimonadales bacterium]|nr:glycosyltransferase [Gemmatimonadales bacterium]